MRIVANKTNLTQSIVADLGVAIVTGHYNGLNFPTEKDLCTQYCASRTVLREAVKMLTAKGLLSARPRQGTRVEPEDSWNLLDPDVLGWLQRRAFSLDFLIEFTEIRLAVEPVAAALAARNGSAEEKSAIGVALGRMQAADRGEGDSLAADIAFHASILNASGNRFYRHCRDMIETALRICARKPKELKAVETSNIEAHTGVAEAVLAGDAVQAEIRMRAQLERLLSQLREARGPQD